MIEILVLTYVFASHQIKYFVLDDFILRQNIFHIDSMRSNYGISYELLDLNSDILYRFPFKKNVKAMRKWEPSSGSWSVSAKEIYNTEVKEVLYNNYNCLEVIELNTIESPLGSSLSKTVKYYANLDALLGNFKPSTYMFLGFSDFNYDPFKCVIKRDFIDADDHVVTTFYVDIAYEMFDQSIIYELLDYPSVSEDELKRIKN